MINAKVKTLLNATKDHLSQIDELMSSVNLEDEYTEHLLEEALSTTTSAIEEISNVVESMNVSDNDDDDMTLELRLAVDCASFAKQDADFWLGPTVMDVNTPHDAYGVTGYTIVCCTGGPHIHLDTQARKIIGRWGRETCEIAAPDAVCQEVFQTLRGAQLV